MKTEEALNVLYNVTAEIALKRKDAQLVEEAFKVIAEALQKEEAK